MRQNIGIAGLIALGMTIAAPAQVTQPPVDTPAIAAAKANRARMKTAPALTSEGIDELQAEVEAERSLGHHGVVVVEGAVDADGRMLEPRLRTSSRAPLLDRIALAAARTSVFSPARDAGGATIAVWIAMPFEFQNQAYAAGGGVVKYRCAQFVEDTRWWRATWPERPWSDYEFFLLMRGFGVVAALGTGDRKGAEARLGASDFETRWQAAQVRCAAKPDGLFAKVSGLMDR